MAVPTTMSDLNQTAASNFPTGTESIGNSLDDYLRAHAAILRQTYALASAPITAAATVNIAAADGESVAVTGAATITSLGTGYAGLYREVRFSGVCTITHSTALWLGGSNITTQNGDILCFRATGTTNWLLVSFSRGNTNIVSPTITGTATYVGNEVGFRSVPQTVTNATYTFVLDDNGKCRVKNTTSAFVYTVPPSIFSAGHVVTVFNGGTAGAITLAQGAGVTLWLGGSTTTGARTIAPGGLATIFFTSATVAVVSGPGVS